MAMARAIARATVFGGSGFVGRYVVERLADHGAVVTVAVRDPEAAKFLKPLGDVGQVTPIRADLLDEAAVRRVVEGADSVVNLVGILARRGRCTFRSIHVEGAARVARAAVEAGARRFVHVSAIGADGGTSDYARSKMAGEAAVREHFPQATIVRPSIIFGPEDGFFNLFAGLARMLPALPLYGGGKTRFQPVFVGDVAAAIMGVLEDPAAAGLVYELAGPRVYSFAQLMRLVLETTQRRRLLVPVPYFVGALQAMILELLPRPPLTRDQLRQLRRDNVANPERPGLQELGIAPTAVEAVLATYLARYRRRGGVRPLRAA